MLQVELNSIALLISSFFSKNIHKFHEHDNGEEFQKITLKLEVITSAMNNNSFSLHIPQLPI